MTATTAEVYEIPVDDVLAEHEFEIPCVLQLAIEVFGRARVIRTCKAPARWTARTPCCGYSFQVCDKHRRAGRTLLECGQCGRKAPMADSVCWQAL